MTAPGAEGKEMEFDRAELIRRRDTAAKMGVVWPELHVLQNLRNDVEAMTIWGELVAFDPGRPPFPHPTPALTPPESSGKGEGVEGLPIVPLDVRAFWHDRALAAERELADADKLLETVRVAMGTSSVMEGLNVIDGLKDALAAAELYRLREAVKAPDGYDSWQAAATDERMKRVAAERERVWFAWFPIRAWYRQEVRWVWLKWIRLNSTFRFTGSPHSVAEFEE